MTQATAALPLPDKVTKHRDRRRKRSQALSAEEFFTRLHALPTLYPSKFGIAPQTIASQSAFAKAIDVRDMTVSDWARGVRPIPGYVRHVIEQSEKIIQQAERIKQLEERVQMLTDMLRENTPL